MPASMLGVNMPLNPIEIDPPDHHGHRRNLNPLFTPKAVKAMGDSVRRTCNELISRFAGKGGCEFIHDFAIPFPTYIFLDLMDMPREKAGDFLEWEKKLMRAPDPMQRAEAARAIFHYLEEHKERQTENPTNDLNRAITTAMFYDRPLTHLAKREMRVVIEEFLGRFSNIRIREGEEYRYHTGRTFGMDYLPLVWHQG